MESASGGVESCLLGDKTVAYIVRVWIEHREVPDASVMGRYSIDCAASGEVKYMTDLSLIERFIWPFL